MQEIQNILKEEAYKDDPDYIDFIERFQKRTGSHWFKTNTRHHKNNKRSRSASKIDQAICPIDNLNESDISYENARMTQWSPSRKNLKSKEFNTDTVKVGYKTDFI